MRGDLVISDGESRKTRYECLYTDKFVIGLHSPEEE